MKKIFSFVLSFLLIVSVFPFHVMALTQGDYTYEIVDGEAKITAVSSSVSGDITVPEKLGNYPVVTIGDSAFAGTAITSVYVGGYVKTIEMGAFGFCKSLKNIVFGDSVETLGQMAFASDSVETVHLGAGVNKIATLNFSGMSGLKEITVSSENTFYQSIDGILFSKDAKTLVAFPNNHKEINYTVPEGVETIYSRAFEHCDLLLSLTLSNTVKTIGAYAIANCENLKTLNLGNSIETIERYGITNNDCLTRLELPSTVTTIGDYGLKNANVNAIIIDKNVTSVSRGGLRCDALTDVYFRGTEEEWQTLISGVASMNNTFLNANIHYNWEGDFPSIILREIGGQIRFQTNDDGTYAGEFDIRTRAKITDEEFGNVFTSNEDAENRIVKAGFVYAAISNVAEFDMEIAESVAKNETQQEGYVDVPVNYIQDTDGYYVFTCLILNIEDENKVDGLYSYAYLAIDNTADGVADEWYFYSVQTDVDFTALYDKYFSKAFK